MTKETNPRAVTVIHVAKLANVSPSTVSRAFSGHNYVSEDTKQRVFEAAKSLGFQINRFAQALRSGRSNAVALVVSDIEQGNFASLTKQLQTAFEARGIDLLLFNLDHRSDRLSALFERASSLRLRGLILASSDLMDMRRLEAGIATLRQDDVAIMCVGQRLDRHGIPSVYYDEVDAASRAMDLLARQGRRRIAFLSRIATSALGRERFRGYKKGLSASGIAFDEQLVFDCSDFGYRYDGGYERVALALKGTKFDAILAGSDELAHGGMAALLDCGLTVPRDVAVIGFEGLAFGKYVRPALTTVASDTVAISEKVLEVFAELDEGKPLSRQKAVTRPLIIRQSSGPVTEAAETFRKIKQGRASDLAGALVDE